MNGFSGFGNSPAKQIVDYEKKLKEMGGDSARDTLVSGSSRSESLSKKKANFNYRQVNSGKLPYNKEKLTLNTKTGKYTTYKVGPKKRK